MAMAKNGPLGFQPGHFTIFSRLSINLSGNIFGISSVLQGVHFVLFYICSFCRTTAHLVLEERIYLSRTPRISRVWCSEYQILCESPRLQLFFASQSDAKYSIFATYCGMATPHHKGVHPTNKLNLLQTRPSGKLISSFVNGVSDKVSKIYQKRCQNLWLKQHHICPKCHKQCWICISYDPRK